MRSTPFYSMAMASLAAGLVSARGADVIVSGDDIMDYADPMPAIHLVPGNRAGDAPKRRKPGKAYPFSSARQHARYARQSAAVRATNAQVAA